MNWISNVFLMRFSDNVFTNAKGMDLDKKQPNCGILVFLTWPIRIWLDQDFNDVFVHLNVPATWEHRTVGKILLGNGLVLEILSILDVTYRPLSRGIVWHVLFQKWWKSPSCRAHGLDKKQKRVLTLNLSTKNYELRMNEQTIDDSTEEFSLRQMDPTDRILWSNLLLELFGKDYLESKLQHRK